jgi:SAM-dependent methyltransferase
MGWEQTAVANLNEIQTVLDALYSGVNGYNISHAERTGERKDNPSFTYGEMLLEPFARILDLVKPAPGETFFDLGSGTGKVLVMADQLFPFASVTGIEFLPALHGKACEVLARYETELRPKLAHRAGSVLAKNGDMLIEDLSGADVIFVHATCMTPELIEKLGRVLLRTGKPGARFVLVSRGFFGVRGFDCTAEYDYTNAWNTTSRAYVYQLNAAAAAGRCGPIAVSA